MNPQPTSVRNQRGSVLVTVMVFMALLLLFAGTFVRHVLVSEEEEVDRLLADTRVYWAMMGHMNYMLSRAGYGGVCGSSGKDTSNSPNNTNHSSGCSASADYGDTTVTIDTATLASNSRTTNNIVGSLQEYLDSENISKIEIQTNGSLSDPGFLRWYYPQNLTTPIQSLMSVNDNAANRYWFEIRAVVNDRPKPNPVALDGQIRLDLEVGRANSTGHVGGAGALRDLRDRIGRLTIGLCVVDTEKSGSPAATMAVNGTYSCTQDGGAATVDGAAAIQFIQRNFPFPTSP